MPSVTRRRVCRGRNMLSRQSQRMSCRDCIGDAVKDSPDGGLPRQWHFGDSGGLLCVHVRPPVDVSKAKLPRRYPTVNNWVSRHRLIAFGIPSSVTPAIAGVAGWKNLFSLPNSANLCHFGLPGPGRVANKRHRVTSDQALRDYVKDAITDLASGKCHGSVLMRLPRQQHTTYSIPCREQV